MRLLAQNYELVGPAQPQTRQTQTVIDAARGVFWGVLFSFPSWLMVIGLGLFLFG
jgi:hypothetical protein